MKTLEDIIPKITERTKDGSLKWETSPITDAYLAPLGKYYVRTWTWTDENDGTNGISIGLLKTKSESTFIETVYTDTFSTKYSRYEELHSYARRSALNLNKIIDDIDKELDDMLPF